MADTPSVLSHTACDAALCGVASVGEAAVSGSASEVNKGLVASQQPPARVGVCMRCRYPKGFGDHRCVPERILMNWR